MRKDPSPETVIAAGTKIEGDLKSSDDIWINGEVKGTVETNGNITVGEAANLKADIKAKSIVVAGKVKGTLSAEGMVSLHETAVLAGDIDAKHLMVAKGAIIRGKVELSSEEDQKK